MVIYAAVLLLNIILSLKLWMLVLALCQKTKLISSQLSLHSASCSKISVKTPPHINLLVFIGTTILFI